MITLENINNYDPFERYPYLSEIWTMISSVIAHEETKEAVEKSEDGLYLIKKNDIVIGLTGFFLNNKPDEPELALRWHGIIKEYRGCGYSWEALRLVFEKARYEFPDAQYMGEYILQNEKHAFLAHNFKKMGFEFYKEPCYPTWTIYPYCISPYSCYRIEIDRFLST